MEAEDRIEGRAEDKGRNKNLKVILGITFFSHFLVHTYMILFPVLMPLIRDEFFSNYVYLGLIFTISNLAFGVGAIGAGVLADRFGTKRLMVICAIGMGLSALLTSASTSLYWLTASLFLLGLFASLYHPSGFSLISKSTESRGKAFGVHGVGGSIGLAVTPLLAMPIGLEWGWRMGFAFLAIPGILLGIAILVLDMGEEKHVHSSPSKVFRSLFKPRFILTLAIYACYGLTFQGVIGFIPSFLSEAGGLVLGGIIASTVTLTMGVPGQLVGGYLTDRQGTVRFLLLSFGLLAFVLILLQFLPPLLALIVAFAAGFLIFSSQPGTGSLLAEETKADVRGAAYGLAFMANFGVGAFGTTIAGWVADETGALETVFPAMSIFLILAVILVLWLRHMR